MPFSGDAPSKGLIMYKVWQKAELSEVFIELEAEILPEFGLSAPPVGPYAHLREFLS